MHELIAQAFLKLLVLVAFYHLLADLLANEVCGVWLSEVAFLY
jgi:hypothetical protein